MEKLSYEDFFKMAILKLRDLSKSHGIHSVFSGFNQAFREYFGEDPIKVTQELVNNGKIEIRPVKRGVMIYLPGEAPKSRADQGRKTLSIILSTPTEEVKGLVDEFLSQVALNGPKVFPEDFLEGYVDSKKMLEIVVPGTSLQIDPNSQTIVISPKRHFHYEAKNPPEAKFIIYTHKIGQRNIKIPNDNKTVFKAVTSYEKYCREILDQSYVFFLNRTNNEDMAELLTKEIEEKLDLRAKRS